MDKVIDEFIHVISTDNYNLMKDYLDQYRHTTNTFYKILLLIMSEKLKNRPFITKDPYDSGTGYVKIY